MKVEDYKTGMRVLYANGQVGMVMKDLGVVLFEDGYNFIEDTDSGIDRAGWNISKVYLAPTAYSEILNLARKGPKVWSNELSKLLGKRETLTLQINEVKAQLKSLEDEETQLVSEINKARGA